MKKLVSVFLIMAVLLVGLATFAMADAMPKAPTVGNITVDDEGKVTLTVAGENIKNVNISFSLDEQHGTSFSMTLNKETGLYEGAIPDYSEYPDAEMTVLRIVTDYTEKYDEAVKKRTITGNHYDYLKDAVLVGMYATTEIRQTVLSDDKKTQTETEEGGTIFYDIDGTLNGTITYREETVSALREWKYQGEGDSEPTETSGWATTAYSYEEERKSFEDEKEISSQKTADEFEVRYAKPLEGPGIVPFDPDRYQGYELVSAERTVTEKGTTVSDDDDIRKTTVTNLTTTYTLTETDNIFEDGYKTVSEKETGKTGTVEETRKGTKKDEEDGTRTEVDEKTLTTYKDGRTCTREVTKNNQTYNLITGELRRTVSQDTTEEAKYTSFEYTGTNENGEKYTNSTSGYVAAKVTGSIATVDYEEAKPVTTWGDQYDLTVRLQGDAFYVPESYFDGSYWYLQTGGTQTETRKGKGDVSSKNDIIVDGKTVTSYVGNNTRVQTQTTDEKQYDKETNKLLSTKNEEVQTEARFTEYSCKHEGQTVKDSTWVDTTEIVRSTQVTYNSEGKKSQESETTSRNTYDFVERDSGDGDGSTYFEKRMVSQAEDSIDRTYYSYYYSNGGIYCETASHTEWSLTGGGTRTEKESSERKDYDETGDYTSKTIESSTTIREKGKDDDAVYSENWAVASSDSVRKTYNRDGILTYEEVSRKKPGEEKSEENWYTDAGTLRNTQTTEKYEGKGVGTTVYQTINPATGQVTYERKTSQMKNDAGDWQYTYHYTYNNDNGTLRSKCIQNPDGSEIHYNRDGQLVAAENKDGTWTDAAGKVLGKNGEDENGSYRTEVTFKARTGEIARVTTSENTKEASVYAEYRNGKLAHVEETLYKPEGDEYYEDGVLYQIQKDNKTWRYDKYGNLTGTVVFDPVTANDYYYNAEGKLILIDNDEDASYTRFDEAGNIISQVKVIENGEEHYGEKGKLLFTKKYENDKDDIWNTVYTDGNGREFARLFDSAKSWTDESGDSTTYHTEATDVRIAGIYTEEKTEYEDWQPEKASGKLEKLVYSSVSRNNIKSGTSTSTTSFTKWTLAHGVKTAEVTRTERYEAIWGKNFQENRDYADDVLTFEARYDFDEAGNRRDYSRRYNATTGSLESTEVHYTEADSPISMHKNLDQYDNLQTWSVTDNTDSWNWTKTYYASGAQAGESWSDDLDNESSYSVEYYLNGNKAAENRTENGILETSVEIRYNEDGTYAYRKETTDGVTNTWMYDQDGAFEGCVWKETNEDGVYSYENWDADDRLLYTFTSESTDGTLKETYTDSEGNQLTCVNGDYTLTLRYAGDGWRWALGSWFYIEYGKPATGWKVINGAWYYFDQSGRMEAALVNDGVATYAMNQDGTLADGGWVNNIAGTMYTDTDGTVKTGWQQIGGKWYYFDDGWTFNEAEYKAESFWEQNDYRGFMETGAVRIWNSDWKTKHTYFFNKDGSWDNAPGWKATNGYDLPVEYHYYDKNGNEVTGWQLIDGKWYYFNEEGVLKNGWVGSGAAWYYLDPATGWISTGWVQEKFEDDWYYMNQDGLMQTGWQQIDGTWYYFGSDGTMAANEFVQSGNSWYYMGSSGAMSTGWVTDNGVQYYMDASGVMQTGWQQIEGVWYFFKGSGALAANEFIQSGSAWYYMGSSGAMATGWLNLNGTYYYFNADGSMATGWQQIGGAWYYMDGSGRMVTGVVTLDGQTSYFDINGVWQGYIE